MAAPLTAALAAALVATEGVTNSDGVGDACCALPKKLLIDATGAFGCDDAELEARDLGCESGCEPLLLLGPPPAPLPTPLPPAEALPLAESVPAAVSAARDATGRVASAAGSAAAGSTAGSARAPVVASAAAAGGLGGAEVALAKLEAMLAEDGAAGLGGFWGLGAAVSSMPCSASTSGLTRQILPLPDGRLAYSAIELIVFSTCAFDAKPPKWFACHELPR